MKKLFALFILLYSGIALADDISDSGYIRLDGQSTTTAVIPFALGASFPALSGPALLGIDANEEVVEAVPGVGYEVPLTFTSPLIRTVDAISILDAAADGSTKGAATFAASDFNASSANISIDYTNGQAASGSTKGFLTSADWVTFNSKVSTSRLLTAVSPITGGGDLSADRSFGFDFSTNNTWTGTNRFNGNVGLSTAAVTPGKLKVAGAGYFQNEPNAFGTTSAYTALVLDGGASGALYSVGRANPVNEPFVALSGWDSTSELSLYYGGGGWGTPDATHHYFYAAPSYTETNDTGVVQLTISGTGTLFNAPGYVADDIKFYIGDNSSFGGNVSMVHDATSTGNMLIQAENGWVGYVSSNLLYQIGPALSAPQATPTTATHRLFVTNNETSTTGAIAGIFEVEYSGATANSSAIQGLNVFSHNTSGAGNLTLATSGGGLRNRVLTRQRSTAGTVAQMSGYSFAMVQDASTGTVSLMTPVNVESPTIGSTATTTEYRGLNFETAAVTGTLTTNKFIHIPSMLAGTNRYEVWLDTDAGIFFRAGTQQINSSAANTLDLDAGTDIIFRAATVREASISANQMLFENGATDTYLNWGTNAILKIGSGSTDIVDFTTGATVFNETGADLDFRFEGDTDANLLFLDAGNGRIGIGNAAPSYKLDVTGQVNVTEDIAVASGKKIHFEGMTGDTYAQFDSASGELRFYVNGVLAGGFK